jgi:hypothetical protein
VAAVAGDTPHSMANGTKWVEMRAMVHPHTKCPPLLVLDFAIYLQHILFHAVPVLWRLHRMHHAGLDVDAVLSP